MKQCTDARAAKLLWPKFAQMIQWQLNRHARELYHTQLILARWIPKAFEG